MQAMILAAGFGTRLQPYTHHTPKPLFPLLNTPLLLLIIEQLKIAGFDRIIINCHHLKEQIVTAVQDISGVIVQQEELILGTGGGLRKALLLMDDEPLLVTNGDIYHGVNLRDFYYSHINSKATITLAAHDYPRFNNLKVSDNRLIGFEKHKAGNLLAFTGLHMINPEILRPIPEGMQSCIVARYESLLREGCEINIARVDDSYWTDMGTIDDYLALHAGILTGAIPRWPQLSSVIIDQYPNHYLLADNAIYNSDYTVKDWACIGNARIGKNVTITRSVIWDGAVVDDDSIITDSLIV